MQFDTLFFTFLRQFLEDVALERGCIYDIVVALTGVPHRKAVMMTGGECYVLGSAFFYGADPFGCVEVCRIEAGGCLCVLFGCDIVIVQVPFALGKHAVDAPVQEDSESVVGKFLSCLKVFRSRYIVGNFISCCRAENHGGSGNAAQKFVHKNIKFK